MVLIADKTPAPAHGASAPKDSVLVAVAGQLIDAHALLVLGDGSKECQLACIRELSQSGRGWSVPGGCWEVANGKVHYRPFDPTKTKYSIPLGAIVRYVAQFHTPLKQDEIQKCYRRYTNTYVSDRATRSSHFTDDYGPAVDALNAAKHAWFEPDAASQMAEHSDDMLPLDIVKARRPIVSATQALTGPLRAAPTVVTEAASLLW